MTVTAFDRTTEQRREALAHGNEIRIWRSKMKEALTVGIAAEFIADPPPQIESMRVEHLLRALPYWGRSKTDKFLRLLAISATKTVGGLSDRQRGVLVAALNEWMRVQR